MPALTRRRHPERPECWLVFYGDVQVGSIGVQAGMPLSAPQWRWDCGFYPLSHRGRARSGYAASFEAARAGFEAAWQEYLPLCTEDDFAEHRRQRASTAWKYRMHQTGLPLPTQVNSGQSKCFCGAPLTIATVDSHIEQAHLDMAP